MFVLNFYSYFYCLFVFDVFRDVWKMLKYSLFFPPTRYEDICPSTHNMDVPHVKREDYQLTDIDDGFLVLLNDNGDLREDLKIPDGDLGTQLRAEYDAGKELVVSIRSAEAGWKWAVWANVVFSLFFPVYRS